jgi:pyruvate kinase
VGDHVGVRGTSPAVIVRASGAADVIDAATLKRVVELGWVQPGERVGVTAGLPSGKPGTTSLLQIQTA